MRIYNSLSRKKEVFKKTKKAVRLFVCGPTVYDHSHIGHARTYLAFDIIVRYLRHSGWRVFYLQNITNIDDKIIHRAKKERKNPISLARHFEKKYLEDMKKLSVVSVNRYARASDFIPHIVRQVQALLKKGYAYETSDGYYFDISKFKDYGKLSKRTVAQAEDAVSRIDESIQKRNKGDFALWKFVKVEKKLEIRNLPVRQAGWKLEITNGEPAWATPLGLGRPGWHIEDTAISESFFGPQYDLHGGAIDLKFPHHEAEIAQQEAASGKKPFVKIWMHAGFLFTGGKKMSKSLGNFITIHDFLKKYKPEVLRWIVLNHHYRSPINYTTKLAAQAQVSLNTVQEFLEKLRMVERSKTRSSKSPGVSKQIRRARASFHRAMEDDLNTPQALAAIFDLLHQFQKSIWQLKKTEARTLRNFIASTLKIFGFMFRLTKIPKKVHVFIAQREMFRRNKQFMQADALRKKIKRVGYEVEDTPLGPFARKATN